MATQPNPFRDGLEDVVPNSGRLLAVKEVAEMLAVSEKTVYSLVSRGLIPYLKIGSAVRFRPAAVREWLREREFVPVEVRRDLRKRNT